MLWRFPRKKTAIRHPNNLSIAASRALSLHIIRPTSLVLDYGCGHGDDVIQLRKRGYRWVRGWDPAFKSTEDQLLEVLGMPAAKPVGYKNVVLLSNVINVIEDRIERRETLRDAFRYASESLVITAYSGSKGRKWRDGVITRIGTFQKPYQRRWFEKFVRDALGATAGDMWFHPKHNLAVVFTREFDRATRKALGIAV